MDTFTYKPLQRCEFPVRDSKSLLPGVPCGAPAVAIGCWTDEDGDSVERYLCQDHLDLSKDLQKWQDESGYVDFETWRKANE